MPVIRRTILFTALTSLLAAVPAAAQTTQAPSVPGDAPGAEQSSPSTSTTAEKETKTLGEITVTGIRSSLEAARDIKRDSTQIVDAIVADDIGKLPDTNVAESLGRVSGVQVERGMGEGSDISIRGLRQNVILYNGREIVDATGRGGNGLDQLNTSTYGLLTLVPSDLISRLSVTKLAGADQVSGALGGIVDIQTRHPLNSDGGQQTDFSVTESHNTLAKSPTFETFGLWSNTFADHTVGALLSASYSKGRVVQQGLDTFSGYSAFKDASSSAPTTTRFGDADVRAQNIDDDREKLGFTGVLQWRPSSGMEFTADTFYSKQTADRDRHWIAFNPTAGLSNATYSSNNILLSGTATTPVLDNTEIADIRSDIWSSSLKGSFHASDRLSGSAELSYDKSTAEYYQRYFRLQPVAGINPVVDFNLASGDFGAFGIHGIDLTDPNQLRLTIEFDNRYRAHTDTFAARTDWTLDFDNSVFHSLDFGVRYHTLDTVENPLRADIRPTGGVPANQLGAFLVDYNNENFLPNEFAGLPREYLAFARGPVTPGCSAFTAFPQISQNSQCLDPLHNTLAYGSTFEVDEKFYEGYMKANFETPVGDKMLSGNFGVRYVNRNLDSYGNLLTAAGTPTPTVYSRTDGDWLPSAVAKFEFSDTLIVRGGAAKVEAFPNTEDLNNGVTLNNNAVFQNGVQITPGTGTGGAPSLDPFKANQYDLSLEYYYDEGAIVSAGLFYKDISSFIIQRQRTESYGGVTYLVNRQTNGQGANVKGIELLAQVPFTFLPVEGFGVVATYTRIDSETPITDITGRSLTFPGLSKNNANLIAYYEHGPFSARVAYNWRDQYLVALSAAATGIYNDTYSDLALTLRYNLNANMALKFEGDNLLNSQQRTYDGSTEGLRTNVVYGRTYKATFSMHF